MSQNEIKLKFMGAARTVTGSKHLLQLPNLNILVDCGLFQGFKYLRELNWKDLPVNPSTIDVVLISHAHLDHSGYIPLLVKGGFKGKFYLTPPTRDLTEIILRDSAKIQEEDARKANLEGYSKHHPALPLYNQGDVARALDLFELIEDDQWFSISNEVKCRFRKNGHILGSCFIEIEYLRKRIVFSGDLGKERSITLSPPNYPEKADILVMESTYGDKLHPTIPAEDELYEVIHEALRKKGNILISSFAVGRAQELMVVLHHMREENKIPQIPIYIDSPMGFEATKIMMKYPQWHKLNYKEEVNIDEDIFFVKSVEDTYNVIETPGSKIIIAASGMLTGGRVLHYLKHYLEEKDNTILLVGYQAGGTRGRTLKEGGHELKIQGKYYKVKANVREIKNLSAHADQQELVNWIGKLKEAPKKIFLVHGEPEASCALQVKIKDNLGFDSTIPDLNEEFTIDW